MKLETGDKVKFLNEKGEGIITKIINKTTVAVTIEDGFELPFLISELVAINNKPDIVEENKSFKIEAARSSVSTIVSDKKEIYNGIYFAVSPEKINDIANSDFNFWIINQTEYTITFSFSVFKKDGFETLCVSNLKPFQTLLVETIAKNELDNFNNLKIDVLFHNEKLHKFRAPVSEFIKFKAVKFYKDNVFIKNDFLKEKAFVITVWDYEIEKSKIDNFKTNDVDKIDFSKFLVQKQTYSDRPKVSKANNNLSEFEIDLHIEELLDDYSGMNNGQIIQIQLNHLQKAINRAIANKYKRLIVIHGVGNGRLKQEVRSILALQNMHYFDGSFSKYGYGATEVVIG